MKKRVLFIASLPNKKFNFDGERNKSRDVLNALKKTGKYSFSIINFTKNKYLQMLKMIFCQLFIRYKYIFVSKCIVGGSRAIHHLLRIRHNSNIYFYIIGNGYYGFDDKTIYFDDISKCKHLIVESDGVKESMILKNCSSDTISVFPCLKPKYDLTVLEKHYQKNQPLKLLYFSRINPEKGLGDLIDVLIKINSKYKEPIFYLDIAGGVSNEPGIKEFAESVVKTCEQYNYLNYLGMSLRIEGKESYLKIQDYDLHVFPSRFKQECAPGSILDMFVAGVPTLSSMFPSYCGLLNEKNSILFVQNDLTDFENKLMYVYINASRILNEKRKLSHAEYSKYTDEAFVKFLESIDFD